MAVRAVLFDYDGVIVDSMPELYKGVCAVLQKCNISVPSFEHFCRTYAAPYLDYYRSLGVTATQDDIDRWYAEEVQDDNIPLVPNFPEMIISLVTRGMVVGIVSARDAHTIKARLHKETLLAYFSFIAGDSHMKDQALQDFCRRFHFGPEEVLFVGDLISDIRDGKKAGCVTVACTKWLIPESLPPSIRPDAHITELRELFSVLGVNPTLRS